MVLDYSKWDNLELSDDSDIEVHPNVDKRSFIRAKQNQIHQQRLQRKHQIETLKYERVVNDGLITRIDELLKALQSHEESSRNPDELVFQALIESAGDPSKDQPPPRPEGVYARVEEQPTYSKMMAVLIDQVKKEVDNQKPENRLEGYIKEIQVHQQKVNGLQNELLDKLAELEEDEHRKITSESIHTGFDSTFISKSKDNKSSSSSQGKKAETVEVLNPGALKNQEHLTRADGQTTSSGAEADVEEAADETGGGEENIEPTKLGKEFAKIKVGDYRASLQFISEHPDVVTERETDGLLIEGFNNQMAGNEEYARQCIHQGLLLQYCRTLGRDGVGLFFKRITTPGHQAQKVFQDDVSTTYGRIKTRAAEIAKERASGEGEGAGGVEQIQLHAVDPGTSININIPRPDSEEEVEKKARGVFDSFPPGLQRALESGSLDEVNKVLAKMSVEEAEEVVGQLGENGMLSLEENIIDATTEEGQKALKEIEAQEKARKEEVTTAAPDPE
ncbi:Cdc37 family protein [Xylona heveae TC161]|uniref:Hsp90 chaperone protein kinase-targeting subunit n=1 Tax=Xylona heveae (strain CBS 132557 / TC161) TaxID=1328760 RepID=A0A165G4C5_XYLHT|nr:Cdc37 family protein [Xylona heveae TC161]KZF21724.1 Cdc37 family protein [Xylona heveae TC161]